MSSRSVARLVVVAAISLFVLYAPTRDQSAATCPNEYEIWTEFWRVPVCEGDPPICEQTQPQLLGTYKNFCDGTTLCEGACDGVDANRIVVLRKRPCPACLVEEP